MFRHLALAVLFAVGCARAAEPVLHTYTDAKRGFSISYPDGWTVDPTFQDKGYAFHQGDMDDFRDGVALKPIGDLAPGTNLQSDQLVLAVQTPRPADRCVASAFLVDPPPDFSTETPVNKPDVVRTVAQPGDLYIVEHVVIIASHTPCLAVHYYINSARIGRGDPAKPFDEPALIAYLNRIAGTIRPAK